MHSVSFTEFYIVYHTVFNDIFILEQVYNGTAKLIKWWSFDMPVGLYTHVVYVCCYYILCFIMRIFVDKWLPWFTPCSRLFHYRSKLIFIERDQTQTWAKIAQGTLDFWRGPMLIDRLWMQYGSAWSLCRNGQRLIHRHHSTSIQSSRVVDNANWNCGRYLF